MKKAFLLGSNVENSLSPFIHNYWLKKYKIAGTYEAISLTIAQAPGFLCNFVNQGFVGGNVTMPFKKMAFYLSDNRQDCPIAVANTLWWADNKIMAGNSDIIGFEKLLRFYEIDIAYSHKKALILGTGGSAQAVAYVLTQMGYQIYFASRNIEAENIISYKNIEQHKFALLVNTTPCTMINYDSSALLKSLNLEQIYKNSGQDLAVIDIVYNPAKTKLLQAAQALNIEKTASGLVMLLGQAAYGFYNWFGVMPQIDEEMLGILTELL